MNQPQQSRAPNIPDDLEAGLNIEQCVEVVGLKKSGLKLHTGGHLLGINCVAAEDHQVRTQDALCVKQPYDVSGNPGNPIDPSGNPELRPRTELSFETLGLFLEALS